MTEFLQIFFIFIGCIFSVFILLMDSLTCWTWRSEVKYALAWCILYLLCAVAIVMSLWRI